MRNHKKYDLNDYTITKLKALPFHSSTRVRLKNLGQIKDTGGSIIGMKCRAQVIKNRLGPPLRHADFNLYFDSGIDDEGSWLQVLKDHKLVKQSGAWYSLEYEDEVKKFQSKDFKELIDSNPELKEHLYNLICKECILKYQTTELGIDDVEYDDVVLGDD